MDIAYFYNAVNTDNSPFGYASTLSQTSLHKPRPHRASSHSNAETTPLPPSQKQRQEPTLLRYLSAKQKTPNWGTLDSYSEIRFRVEVGFL
jgi:hypothetical protein